MFQAGKQVHEPGKQMPEFGTRKASTSITDAVRRVSTSSSDGLDKTVSGSGASPSSPSGQRRRVCRFDSQILSRRELYS